MIFEMVTSDKIFFTKVTFEGSFSCVGSEMNVQIASLVEGLTTILTLEWFLSCVDPHVDIQMNLSQKCFLADLTNTCSSIELCGVPFTFTLIVQSYICVQIQTFSIKCSSIGESLEFQFSVNSKSFSEWTFTALVNIFVQSIFCKTWGDGYMVSPSYPFIHALAMSCKDRQRIINTRTVVQCQSTKF